MLLVNDVSCSLQIDAAVRSALLPGLDLSSDQAGENLRTPALGFAHPSELPAHGVDSTLSISTLRSSHLEKIQKILLRGDRRAAYQYAADEKLWAHAMVIASSIDKEAWKEVVNEFVRSELSGTETADGALARTHGVKPAVVGREPLRVAYSLFAGYGAAASKSTALALVKHIN